MGRDEEVKKMLTLNKERNREMFAKFDPYTGEGSILDRTVLDIADFAIPRQWVPLSMMREKEVRLLKKYGSIKVYVEKELKVKYGQATHDAVAEMIIRLRSKHDFCFWAASFAYVFNKDGGKNVLFRLRKPQRKLVDYFERCRLNGEPIRLILLKARQWGGSTAVQIYMAWLQFCHKEGLNSLICAHVGKASAEIEDMFRTLVSNYPTRMLHKMGESFKENEVKWEGVGGVQGIHRVPQRNCKIKVGMATTPDSCRGGSYALLHCSEVGLWQKTENKSAEDIAQSAMSGILLKAMTMIVMESTAKGVGNYFHREYMAAARGDSQFDAMFVAWWEIELYRLEFEKRGDAVLHAEGKGGHGMSGIPNGENSKDVMREVECTGIKNDESRKIGQRRKKWKERDFAEWLWNNRNESNPKDERSVSGQYLWWLWEIGASLESIYWYVEERKKYGEQGMMASEFPSDAQEAFVNSGANVFDKQLVERLKKTCRMPKWVGELEGRAKLGEVKGFWGLQEYKDVGLKGVLEDLKFCEDRQSGRLSVWAMPEEDDGEEYVKNRYLVVVDVGGRGTKADWSVICVIDRYWMMEGGKPSVVAQWYGHVDMDILAWKSAQIAKWYNDALLVIESNTLETKDRDRYVDGDQTSFILLQIKEVYSNLYARRRSEDEIAEGAPVKYGFHTNVSTKPMVISTLIKVVREAMYNERDEGTLFEYNCYERKQNGSYGATSGNHDDRLMTRAIGLHVCFYEMEWPKWEKKVKYGLNYYKRGDVTEAVIV